MAVITAKPSRKATKSSSESCSVGRSPLCGHRTGPKNQGWHLCPLPLRQKFQLHSLQRVAAIMRSRAQRSVACTSGMGFTIMVQNANSAISLPVSIFRFLVPWGCIPTLYLSIKYAKHSKRKCKYNYTHFCVCMCVDAHGSVASALGALTLSCSHAVSAL